MDPAENTGTTDITGNAGDILTDTPPTASQEQAQAQPEQPAPAQGQPATPPNLSEALAQMNQQMNQALEGIRREIRGEEPDDDPEGDFDLLTALTGTGADEPAGDEGGYADRSADEPAGDEGAYADFGDGQDDGGTDLADAIRDMVQDAIQDALAPHLRDLQLRDDARDIAQLKQRYPRLNEPKVGQAVSQLVQGLAERYGTEAIRTDPAVVELAYLAFEAQQQLQQAGAQPASETSQAPEGAEGAPAEAGGSQGATLETGAGPGAPQQEVDPIAKRFIDALVGSGSSSDLITS